MLHHRRLSFALYVMNMTAMGYRPHSCGNPACPCQDVSRWLEDPETVPVKRK